MDVLLDHSVPVPLAALLHGHAVRTAVQEGWDALSSGRLLAAAAARFDVLVTCDRNIVHQQNLSGRTIAIVAVTPTLAVATRALSRPASRVELLTSKKALESDQPWQGVRSGT